MLDLTSEPGSALGAAFAQPNREAATALATTVSPLQWTDPRIASLVQAEAAARLERLQTPTPEVCADLEARGGAAESGCAVHLFP